MTGPLSHINESGDLHMVDVGQKPDTYRVAIAKADVLMKPETLELIRAGLMNKGDVLTTAKVAGVMAAKRTAELIPLCHIIPINSIEIEIELDDQLPGVSIQAEVHTISKTGVEMEALTAVSVTALTIYDMVKSAEKTMRINNIHLVRKSGGQSGDVDYESDG